MITGNLDHSDAEKYDNIIETLKNNQNKIKTLVKDQITLLQTSIHSFKESIKSLAHNQLVLNSRIMQLEYIINTTKVKDAEIEHTLLLQTVLTQFVASYQILYDILERIEVAITFSKLNTFHNSIIEPKYLLSEIFNISKYLSKNKFPFEPILENILTFEKIVEIKSYVKQNQITFILNIPIVETKSYNYYHMYSFPTPSFESFKTIIPQSKYLLSNEQNYAFSDSKCQEVIPNQYLCKEVHTTGINENIPCELQLLKYSKNNTNCQQIPVQINNIKVQKIEKNQWILIAPNSVVAVQKCNNEKENIPLSGSYVIEINSLCEVQIENILIKTFQSSKSTFKNIELPNIKTPTEQSSDNKYIFKLSKLESVSLDNIQNVYNNLEKQKQEINSINNIPIHFHRVSFYTILLYVLLIIICFYVIYRYTIKNKCKAENKETRIPNITLSSNSV